MRPDPSIARRLRGQASEPERLLWGHLRGRRLMGFKFRRQVPIGPYVVDFCCPAARVVVEVDGAHHADQTEEDEVRSLWLKRCGFGVLRFGTAAILSKVQDVLEVIADSCRERCVEPTESQGRSAAE